MKFQSFIVNAVTENIETMKRLLASDANAAALHTTIEKIAQSYRSGGTLFAVGNGGSAADAQHMVGNLVGRFAYDRPPLRAHALTTNSSILTCVGNDYGYEDIFARQIWANAKKDDVLVAFSTSGNSENVVRAVKVAHEIGVFTVGLAGEKGGRLQDICDVMLRAPSQNTARIQETHMLMAHLICGAVESELFPKVEVRS